MKKCDVIIPVYKSPEWVKLCVYSLFINTDDKILNKVYLINDCDDQLTINCLNNLKDKYPKIEIITNEKNLGFIKTCNKGLTKSKADYILLLNTDCIVAKNTISKLIKHIEKDDKIGLICPISSNAANLTLEMFDGFTYMQMDRLLEKKFSGISFDACTVVGNCLMITKECIKKTGLLDEAYGTGYGEETDYQFKAMEKGFKAKVAIDTYVYHKSEASFGSSKEKQEKQLKNRELFFSRWGKKYNKLMKEYVNNDPIKYINNNITDEDKKINFEFLIYLIGFSQNAGGVHTTVDMINYLTINDYNCNITYDFNNGYSEIMLFNPIQIKKIDSYKFKKIVATIYHSIYYAKVIADKYNIPLVYYAQGYEPYFENGKEYGIAELSYKLADDVLTISSYLKNRYKDMFKIDSTVISNGVNTDLLYNKNTSTKIKTITIMLRNNVLKGDYILLDIYKKITNKYNDLNINLIYSNEEITFPQNNNKTIKVNKILGPLTRKEITDILQKSDLYIDASFTEGFGLMALEAMTAGNVAIVSNSGGIKEYIQDGINGYIINGVNNIEEYIEKIDVLLNNNKEYLRIKNNINNDIKKHDYDKVINEYIEYFNKNMKHSDKTLNEYEEKIYDEVLNYIFRISNKCPTKNLLYKICKKTPKRFRVFIKKQVERLYKFTNER